MRDLIINELLVYLSPPTKEEYHPHITDYSQNKKSMFYRKDRQYFESLSEEELLKHYRIATQMAYTQR